ncbi:hypothetical protein ABW20_dc0101083 [Dactylellina cionopaga]|nr:hypothetical protein ABW20_dc0101083 [Dactylellina cionopaga]
MQQVATKRWEESGKPGVLSKPGPIDLRATAEPDDAIKMGIDDPVSPGIEGTHAEGRGRKRNIVDYRVFGPAFDLLEEDDEDVIVRGRGRRHSRALVPMDDLDEDGVLLPQGGRGGELLTFLPSDGIQSEKNTPIPTKPPYTGKKRGRPKKPRPEDPRSDGITDTQASFVNPTPTPTANELQKKRRQAIIEATSKVHALDWSPAPTSDKRDMNEQKRQALMQAARKVSALDLSKRAQGPMQSGPSASMKNSPSMSVKQSDIGKEITRKRSSMTATPSGSNPPTISIQHSERRATTVHDQLANEMISAPRIASPPPLSRWYPNDISRSPSTTSNSYESASSTNQDTIFPAGILRLAELPTSIKATIPKEPEYFSRHQISALIGGNPQKTICTTKPKPDAPIETKGYLAVLPNWNPQAPPKAGQHGSIMQLSSVTLDPISQTQANFPVFVARGKKQWEYCGQYVVAEIAELNAFERWMHLSDSKKLLKHWGEEIVQKKYDWAKAIFMEKCGWSEVQWKNLTHEMVTKKLESGEVPMRWMHLECVGFNTALYEALLGKKVQGVSIFIYIGPADED